jgi:DNA repair exonuclease SbcCD ATPase subunit
MPPRASTKQQDPCHNELHEHILQQLQQGFTFLSEKYGELSLLPQKLEQQTKILEEIKSLLSAIPEHATKLAIMEKELENYQELTEKVTAMEAERKFLRWQLPFLLVVAQTIITIIVSFWVK